MAEEKAIVKWTEPTRNLETFSIVMDETRDKIEALLPEGVPLKRFIQTFRNVIGRDPSLLRCSPKDLMDVCMRLAELGLYAGGTLPEAHVVVFNVTEDDGHGGEHKVPKPQIIVDYKGLVKLAIQHPSVLAVDAQIVCEGDEFDYHQGTEPYIVHKPDWRGDRKNVTGAYAVGWLLGDRVVCEVMNYSELEKIHAQSKLKNRGKDSPSWQYYPGEMYRKTAFRRLSKWLPKSPRLYAAIELMDEAEGLRDAERPPEVASASEAVDKVLTGGAGESAATETQAVQRKLGDEIGDDEIPTE